eukprot:403331859
MNSENEQYIYSSPQGGDRVILMYKEELNESNFEIEDENFEPIQQIMDHQYLNQEDTLTTPHNMGSSSHNKNMNLFSGNTGDYTDEFGNESYNYMRGNNNISTQNHHRNNKPQTSYIDKYMNNSNNQMNGVGPHKKASFDQIIATSTQDLLNQTQSTAIPPQLQQIKLGRSIKARPQSTIRSQDIRYKTKSNLKNMNSSSQSTNYMIDTQNYPRDQRQTIRHGSLLMGTSTGLNFNGLGQISSNRLNMSGADYHQQNSPTMINHAGLNQVVKNNTFFQQNPSNSQLQSNSVQASMVLEQKKSLTKKLRNFVPVGSNPNKQSVGLPYAIDNTLPQQSRRVIAQDRLRSPKRSTNNLRETQSRVARYNLNKNELSIYLNFVQLLTNFDQSKPYLYIQFVNQRGD